MNKLSKEIHEIAKSKGFWDTDRNVGELLMLCVSELGEALEAHRKDRFADFDNFNRIINLYKNDTDYDIHAKQTFEDHIKDTFEDEIADTVIRLLDMCALFKIDIEKHIELKMAYNKTRERLHGKRY